MQAVLVGGASGMGRATAEKLGALGARVAILDLPSSDGAAVAKELGGGAVFRPCVAASAIAVGSRTGSTARAKANSKALGFMRMSISSGSNRKCSGSVQSCASRAPGKPSADRRAIN